MLCAKNLKVALAAILGVVGLMGAGTAHATIKLVPEDAAASARTTGHSPQYFAAEALAAASTATSTLVMVSATSSGFNVNVPDISAGLEATTTYYLRFDLLEGGGFSGGRNSTSRSSNEQIAIAFSETLLGGATNPQLFDAAGTVVNTGVLLSVLGRNEAAIYTVDTVAALARGDARVSWVIAPDAGLEVGLSSPDEEKTYYLRMSIWNGRGDAERADFENLGSQAPIWAAANTIVITKRTLTTAIQDAREITATVASDFRRFMPESNGGSTGSTTDTMGRLVTATVTFADAVSVGTGAAATTHHVRNHDDGDQILLTEVLDEVNASVTGNVGADSYNFGNFYLGDDCTTGANAMVRNAAMGSMVAATATSTASLSKVLSAATVAGALATVTNSAASRAQFVFCANVTANTEDQMPMMVFERINEVVYSMELNTELVGHTGTQFMTTGGAGAIDRDGTEVRIAYLTTATGFGGARSWQDGAIGAYNQRLVIVNHGNSAVGYQLGQFAPEAMLTVEAQAGANLSGSIAPRSSTVMRVRDLIQIMEDGAPVAGRTAAVLTLVGAPDDISVATTQVTLPEGQTDTVRYHPLTER